MDSELIRIQQREKVNQRNLIEEGRKAAMLASLYVEKRAQMYDINERQQRFNRNINAKRKEMERAYIQRAEDIIHGRLKKKRTSIIRRIFTPQILFYSLISIIIYIFWAKLAYIERGYKAIGGEGFFLILPLLLVAFRIGNIIDKEARKEDRK